MTFTNVEILTSIDREIETGHFLRSHYWNTTKHQINSSGILPAQKFYGILALSQCKNISSRALRYLWLHLWNVWEWWKNTLKNRSIRSKVFCKKGVLKNLTKFAGKYVLETWKLLWLQQSCFPKNFIKFLRRPILDTSFLKKNAYNRKSSKNSSLHKYPADVRKFSHLPSKHLLVFKTSWRHALKTSWRHVLKTSWRRLLKT